jgi:hypothetical protein
MKTTDFLTELSTDKLAQYKTAAAADASKADKESDFKRGDKRFSGIVKATKKQFDNDAKKGVAEGWKDEANDYKEWSNHVKDELLSVSPSQRYSMAQRLSQIEHKHFASNIQTGFNAQTGRPDSTSDKSLTSTVSQIYRAIEDGSLGSAAPTAPGTQSTAFGTVTKPAGHPDPYHTSPALAGGDRQAALARLKGDSNYPAATTLRGPSSGSIKILRTEEEWEEALNNQDSGDDGPMTAAGFGAAMSKLPSWKVMLATIMLASKIPVIGDKIKNTIISSIKNEFGVQMSFKEALGYMQHVRTTPPEEIVSPAVWKFEKDGGDYETAIEQLPDEDVNVSPAHVMATISNDLISSGVAQEINPGKEEKPTSGGAGAFGNMASQLTQKKEPVAEGMEGAVDSKGRTQSQWMELVKRKYPAAKIMQSKMIDGPATANLGNGKTLTWNKVKPSVAEGSTETTQQQQVRAAITKGMEKWNQNGLATYQSQPAKRHYFASSDWASGQLKGINSIDPDGTVVIELNDTTTAGLVKKLASLGGMPGVKTRQLKMTFDPAKMKNGVTPGEVAEEKCPHCNGPMFSEMIMNEKKDACYYKVKSRYKVWPSAYASGALVKCRNKGASNWGNSSKNESSILEGIEQADESLHDWFNKEKWVRMDTKGNIKGPCAKEPGEGKPKCLPQSKAHSLGKKGRASAAARKRREDPNPDRSGKAINVNTKKTKG